MRIMDMEAEALTRAGRVEEALAVRRSAVKRHDPDTSASTETKLWHEVGIADLTAKRGDPGAAVKLLSGLTPTIEARFGENHPLTAVARYAWVSASAPLEEATTSLANFNGLHRKLERALGAEHILTLKAEYGVGRCYERLEDFRAAADVFQELAASLDDRSDDAEFRIRTNKRWAETLVKLNQFRAAADKYADCAAEAVQLDEGDVNRVASLKIAQADCLVEVGAHHDARALFVEAWRKLDNFDDRDEALYRYSAEGIARCLIHLGNHGRASFILQKLLDSQLSEDRWDVSPEINLRRSLAWNYEMAGNRAEAAKHYGLLLDLMQRREFRDDATLEELRLRLACNSEPLLEDS
jgi:tetratricopeptide (TPR) repeat protein